MTLARQTDIRNGHRGQIVHFAFANKKPPLAATVAIADAFRAAALSAFHVKIGGNDSFLLSGHNADGTPDKENRHAFYLPIPDTDGTSTLSGILVASPVVRFSEEEVAALCAITTVRWNGPSTKLNVELVDIDDQSVETLARRWESTTPYVPMRQYWGTHGKRHLVPEKQLAAELQRAGVPDTTIVEIDAWCKMRIRLKPPSLTCTGSHPALRLGFRVVLSTSMPILGPIALGHSSHFGLGQFRPKLSTP